MRFDTIDVMVGGMEGLVHCPEDGYTEIGSWPPSTAKEFGNVGKEVQTVDGTTVIVEEASLTACQQLYILKRFYEAFLLSISTLDADGQSMSKAMINRLIEVMNKAEKITCAPEIPQLLGGIGALWKKLSPEQIIDLFAIKGMDPAGAFTWLMLHGIAICRGGHPSGEPLCQDNMEFIQEKLVKSGQTDEEIAAMIASADISYQKSLMIDENTIGDWPIEEINTTPGELQEYLDKQYGGSFDLTWPPSDDLVELYALWRYYNGECLKVAGTNDYHGLMRGRGFISAVIKDVVSGEKHQLDQSPSFVKAAFNSFWKENDHNLASGGQQASIAQSQAILAHTALEHFHGPGSEIEWVEIVFVEDLGEAGTYIKNSDDVILGYDDIGVKAYKDNHEYNNTIWNSLSAALGFDAALPPTPEIIIYKVGEEPPLEPSEALENALLSLGRGFKFEVVTLTNISHFRAMIRRLWEIEEKFRQLGYGPEVDLYKNSTPAILQGEEKVVDAGYGAPWEPFLSKYFDNPLTGERDIMSIARICGVKAVRPQDEGPPLFGSMVTHKYVSKDNWIAQYYGNPTPWGVGGYDDWIKSLNDWQDNSPLTKASPEYPKGVYGPDINGWFWKEDSVNGKFLAWPEEGDVGHDPFQPAEWGTYSTG